MFQHYLITRFNLKKDNWKTSKNDIPVLTEDWLERRFELFENFCYPSVKGQQNQNFTWLVYFDIDTPQGYKDKIEALTENYPNFQPRFVEAMRDFIPGIQDEIKTCREDYIITSRLDNDDCLRKDYIATVQENFIPTPFMAIDFPDGYTLQISPEFKIGKKRQSWNPFISLIEVNDQPESVWRFEQHGRWKREKSVKRINDQRIWMSVIHRENKVNEFTGYADISEDILDKYAISEAQKTRIAQNLVPVGQWTLQRYNNYWSTHTKCIYKDIKRFIRLSKQ